MTPLAICAILGALGLGYIIGADTHWLMARQGRALCEHDRLIRRVAGALALAACVVAAGGVVWL